MLVHLPERQGIGKVESVDEESCSVRIFRSIIRSNEVQVPLSTLERAFLSSQTRVYVRGEDHFRVGRVTKLLADLSYEIDSPNIYEVRFPNGEQGHFSETYLYIRPWSAPDDPAEVLANGGSESQFLHDRRRVTLQALLKLRGAAQGMTAFTSAGIDLTVHQITAVRRVLTDPVQRYLLADEVGLGKTIEAGLIIRQHLIDNPAASVTVAVPTHLSNQWVRELNEKLRLDQFGDSVEVITHADLDTVEEVPEILVVDEAHHLVGITTGPLASAASRLSVLAGDVSVLLLLSATPALGDEARFLALLNLLDPASHPLDDIEGFRQKLEGRREIGRLLLALDPEAPKLGLRQRCAEMERLFPEDRTVRELAPMLIAATRKRPEEISELCTALKAHIADAYRIHQRLIRSRRADAESWAFTPRGPSDTGPLTFPHVLVEAAESEWVKPLLPVLEEWRFAAIDASAGNEGALNDVARRYASLLGAIGQGPRGLTAWLSKKDEDLAFEHESEILSRLSSLSEENSEEWNYATACEVTSRILRTLSTDGRSPKLVAFSSSPTGAREFHTALGGSKVNSETFLITGSNAKTDERTIADFRSSLKPAVLVCGPNGEEGLNLTFADGIVHIDLPMAAARIEQRVGRLDRFGRKNGVVRHRILLPEYEDDSPWTGWSDFLREGLGLFHRSISDIQFLLEDLELRAFRVLLEQGPDGVRDLSLEVRRAIQDERRSQDEQYALDRIALAEESSEAFVRALEIAEEDEAALERDLEEWLINVLRLEKRPVAWPKTDPFRLKASGNTLIPKKPWLKAFELKKENALTWRRRIASAHPEAILLRPGTPLLDVAERFTRWDDRGTAFITWRTEPEWANDLWLGFCLSFVIEPDIRFSNMLSPSRVEFATQRRAQRYLAPRVVNFFLDIDGNAVDDSTLISILKRPFRLESSAVGQSVDVNLSSRPHILNNIIDQNAFGTICKVVRDRGRSMIRSDKTINDAVSAGERLAFSDLERRRRRLRQKESPTESASNPDIVMIESILPAIKAPAITLDSMGCFIVSREPPVLD